MGMPFISITTTGMALTVIREDTISPVLCMILSIEALKTQIDGPTLSRARAEISHITICPRFMERINLEELVNPFISINTIDRLDSVMGLVPTNILCFPYYIFSVIFSFGSSVNIPCTCT